MLIKRITTKIFKTIKSIIFNIEGFFIGLFHKKDILRDVENRTYETIVIGNQEWMLENLCTGKFANGDLLQFIDNDDEWQLAGKNGIPAWSYFNDDPCSEIKYGKLYNWHAVNDPRGLAPDGWHIPTDEDWCAMISFLGGEKTAGKKLKSRRGWKNEGNGSDKSGFNALPGGYRDPDGWFGNGGFGRWWSSTEESDGKAWRFRLGYDNETIDRYNGPKGYGFSIRCIKN